MTLTAVESDADRKLIDTLVARGCLAGFQIVRLIDGTFIVSKFGLFRSLDHIAAGETFLQRAHAPTT